MKLKRSTRKY